MQPRLPAAIILDIMRREHPDGHPPLRLHAPSPEPPHDPGPPKKDRAVEEVASERGVAIIDFTI